MSEELNKHEQEFAVSSIGRVLDSIKGAEVTASGRQDFADELKRRTAGLLWRILPAGVTELNLGTTSVSRSPEVIQRTPEDQRQTWSLADLDHHAEKLANQIGKPWEPRYR